MSDNRDIITFENSGLNTDTDILALPKGDSRYRLNVVLSDDGNHQVLTQVKGNTNVSYTFTVDGTYRVVGSVEDKENSACIYFVHDSSGNGYHSIIRYNYSAGTFTDILSDQVNLLPDSFTGYIDSGIIGNEDDQYLVWTDGYEPKMINIAYAIAGSYNSTITDEELSFYKRPLFGSSALIATLYYSLSTEFNTKLDQKCFQFAIRLRYYDKTYSVLSSYSNIPMPIDNMSSGKISAETRHDRIQIDFNIQNEPTIVESYQILFRNIDIGEGSPGIWYIYKDIDYTTKGAKTEYFYNDGSIGEVGDTEAVRPYDYVPIEANHVGIIDSNIAVFDTKKEGFDNVSLNVSSDVSVDLIDEDEDVFYNGSGDANTGGGFDINETMFPSLDLYFTIYVGGGSYHSIYTKGLDGIQIGSFFKTYFDGLSISGLTITDSSTSDAVDLNFSATAPLTVGYLVLHFSNTYTSLKSWANYKFGVEYGYNGRRGWVQTDEDFKIYADPTESISITGTGTTATVTQTAHSHSTGDLVQITGATQDVYNGVYSVTVTGVNTYTYTTSSTISISPATGNPRAFRSTHANYTIHAEIDLNHTAPTGATDFRIVSFGSDVDRFEEYFVNFSNSDITDSASSYTMYLDGNYTVIKKTEIVNRMRKAYGDGTYSIDYGLDFQAGDYVRIAGFVRASGYPITLSAGIYMLNGLEYRIDVVNDTEIKFSSSAIRYLDANFSDSTFIVQIIRKKDSFSSTPQEFSLSYPISNHGSVIDVTDYFGDVFKSRQVFTNRENYSDYGTAISGFPLGLYSWMEKDRISLLYDSYPSVYGRVNLVNEFSEQRSFNKIRWGGKYLDESGVNFLSKFESDDERVLDDRNGKINKIEQIGDTLKVYQERKVTSFYLKTTSSTDAQGNSTYVFSDQVMSEGRQTQFDYGCTNFESYIKNVRNAYFFDVINAYVVRDSPAGLEPISDYGMHTFFKEKASQILALGRGNVRVLGTYDDDNDLYIISFIYSTMSNDVVDSVAFHEPTNRWITHFTLPTTALDYYGRISGQTYLSFLNGQLYTHNSNSTRCNFWGSQYGSQVRVHSNINPNLIKVWDSVQVVSTGQWAPSTNGDVAVTIPTAQQSRLKTGKFEIQEGEYRSEFLRDMLSGESTPQENNLFNGDALRGYEVSVNLRNSDTSEANLRMVKINGTTST